MAGRPRPRRNLPSASKIKRISAGGVLFPAIGSFTIRKRNLLRFRNGRRPLGPSFRFMRSPGIQLGAAGGGGFPQWNCKLRCIVGGRGPVDPRGNHAPDEHCGAERAKGLVVGYGLLRWSSSYASPNLRQQIIAPCIAARRMAHEPMAAGRGHRRRGRSTAGLLDAARARCR